MYFSKNAIDGAIHLHKHSFTQIMDSYMIFLSYFDIVKYSIYAFLWCYQPWPHKCSDVFSHSPLHYCFFRSPDVTTDEQPPALPPKQSRKDPLAHNGRSQSQHELDDHLSELYNVPASSGKSMVGKTVLTHTLALHAFVHIGLFDSYCLFVSTERSRASWQSCSD